ncbi:MAG: hypothetical protein ACE37F_03240 [Nannocystaceae bacterium]|nr:hypothetical protein [bacterium]
MKASEIRIPEPCNEDWEGMTPEQRGRFCAACQKTVHDLSAMTERDAKVLLATDEDICVSYLSDARGTVQFRRPQLVPANRLLRRASVASAAGLSLALAACAPHGEGPKIEDSVESSQPTFLEVLTIPEVQPCESEPPLTEPDPEEFMRTKGDYAPEPEPEPRRKVRRMGRKKPKPRRTAGTPLPWPNDPLSGL